VGYISIIEKFQQRNSTLLVILPLIFPNLHHQHHLSIMVKILGKEVGHTGYGLMGTKELSSSPSVVSY